MLLLALRLVRLRRLVLRRSRLVRFLVRRLLSMRLSRQPPLSAVVRCRLVLAPTLECQGLSPRLLGGLGRWVRPWLARLRPLVPANTVRLPPLLLWPSRHPLVKSPSPAAVPLGAR